MSCLSAFEVDVCIFYIITIMFLPYRVSGFLVAIGAGKQLPEEEKGPKYPTPPGGDMY